ncbi:mitochondrial carrier protein [Lithospermum erythrorhizon]|uniref:Mitochondrial carrier protein n=1 Tax=Lithospermum erythrorhizon TaxID=34254 RepID=A0AAV3PQJ4_LITER
MDISGTLCFCFGSIWFEAATVVAVAPPAEIPTGSGHACALSIALLHPVDTIKTQVQASTLTFPEIISKIPQLGAQGLYRGSIPAILGQFLSHGLRTGIFEASKLVLINIAPTLQELQHLNSPHRAGILIRFSLLHLSAAHSSVQLSEFHEVLKQRLQAGLFTNVGDAVIGTWKQDGMSGFFRCTGATLFREVPFYVAGMGLYAESKKVVQQLLGRELEPWETISVGALSGGLTAVLTTPFEVIKTRMMTAPRGRTLSPYFVVKALLDYLKELFLVPTMDCTTLASTAAEPPCQRTVPLRALHHPILYSKPNAWDLKLVKHNKSRSGDSIDGLFVNHIHS